MNTPVETTSQSGTPGRYVPGWSDFLHLSPEAAADAMFAATGVPQSPRAAKLGLKRARDARRSASAYFTPWDTIANFKRSPLGARLPGGAGTTMLYKLITGKTLRVDDNAAQPVMDLNDYEFRQTAAMPAGA
jgi:hypothetical protein